MQWSWFNLSCRHDLLNFIPHGVAHGRWPRSRSGINDLVTRGKLEHGCGWFFPLEAGYAESLVIAARIGVVHEQVQVQLVRIPEFIQHIHIFNLIVSTNKAECDECAECSLCLKAVECGCAEVFEGDETVVSGSDFGRIWKQQLASRMGGWIVDGSDARLRIEESNF